MLKEILTFNIIMGVKKGRWQEGIYHSPGFWAPFAKYPSFKQWMATKQSKQASTVIWKVDK